MASASLFSFTGEGGSLQGRLRTKPWNWTRETLPHLGLLQLGFQISHIQVALAVFVGLSQTDAINDGGMVQLIRQDCVLRGQQGLVEGSQK